MGKRSEGEKESRREEYIRRRLGGVGDGEEGMRGNEEGIRGVEEEGGGEKERIRGRKGEEGMSEEEKRRS